MQSILKWLRKLRDTSLASKRSTERSDRIVVANEPAACVPNNCTNTVSTRRYNWITFFPLSLLYQFRLASNCYFLLLAVLVLLPGIAPVSPFSTIFPLLFVLLVSEVREFVEEYQAAKRDHATNSYPVNLLAGKRIARQKLKPGDLVLLKRDERVPADILILQSSSSDGSAYVETASLDGETNLKVRKCPGIVKDMTLGRLTSCRLEISCQVPHVDMYIFSGSIKDLNSNESEPLSLAHIVWGGCTIRNTEWVAGLVVYCGEDCKVMLNTRSGIKPSKVTSMVKQMNRVVLWICNLQIIVCAVFASIGSWRQDAPWYLIGSGGMSWFSVFFAYFVLLSNLIPVSLWVFTELLKVAQAIMIERDPKSRIKCNSKNINEELGQITHVFTDKTGTLTMNRMKFVGLAVRERMFMLLPKSNDLDNNENDAQDEIIVPKLAFPGVIAPDSSLVESIKSAMGEQEYSFFECLAICHSCERVIEPITGQLSNHSSSPDEAALVCAAAECGFVFTLRPSAWAISVEIKGTLKQFKIIRIIPFTSERRMMSVVVEREDGSICVFTKGADSSVIPLCSAGPVEEIRKAVSSFSYHGYRTLCVAVRELPSDINALEDEHEVERNLCLIGATAVEDRLQEDVPSTLRSLKAAGIKVCMITGDKRETAINIARSCELISSRKNVYVMLTGSCALTNSDGQLADSAAGPVGGGSFVPLNCIDNIAKSSWPNEYWLSEVSALGGGGGIERNVSRETTGTMTTRASNRKNKFSLVIDGKGLQSIFSSESSTRQLVDVLSFEQCEAVVFCRVSPKQKGEIVKTVQKYLPHKGSALAIGDGSNDVPMINLANVGVGIVGNEGSQAANSADFAIAQFSDLYRLVFIHGRWNYRRTCEFLCLFLHKNFAFALVQFWFATVTAFSAVTVYESSYMLLFNSVFGIVPLFLFGLLDKDVDPDADAPGAQLNHWQPSSVSKPYWKEVVVPLLYKTCRCEFSSAYVLKWFLLGIVHSAIAFFFVWASWSYAGATSVAPNGFTPSFLMASILIYTFEIFLISAMTLYASASWTTLLLLAILICNIGAYLLFVFVYDFVFIPPYSWPVYRVAASAMGNVQFWFILAIALSAAFLPLIWAKQMRGFTNIGLRKLNLAEAIRLVKANSPKNKPKHLDPTSHCLTQF